MGFKRTSKKFGTVRRTQTINNKNSSITNSFSTGNKYTRTTHSSNSKTGNRTVFTWRDGAGFTHRKTTYKTPSDAQQRREAKRAQEFWKKLFGSNTKPKRKSTTAKMSEKTTSKPADATPFIAYVVLFAVILVIYTAIV